MSGDLITFIADVLSIVVLDLVLSGDNAVVIGLAARRLPGNQRRLAIVLGGGAAILLRVIFAAVASVLLTIPFLQAIGGVLLVWIAWKLVQDNSSSHEVAEGHSLFSALQTIVLADVVMSLDNILAIAGVSHGSVAQLLIGLLLSMPIILFGSSLVAMIMDRLPWLSLVGAGILGLTAGGMIQEDAMVGKLMLVETLPSWAIPALLTLAVVVPAVPRTFRSRRSSSRAAPASPSRQE